MSLTIELYEDFVLPARYEVCHRCRGTKTHVNPSIDGNGLSREDMDDFGDEFFEDYMSGVYDVICEECHGEGLLLVVDEQRCTPEQLAEFNEYERDRYETEAIYRMERMMGA